MSLSIPHGGTLINRYNKDYDYSQINKAIELDNISIKRFGINCVQELTAQYEGFLNERRL